MDSYPNLLIKIYDGISLVTINRPETLNALHMSMLKQLDQLCNKLYQDSMTKVVVFTGGGDKSFVAGADIVTMEQFSEVGGHEWAKFGQAVFNKIESLPQPVIAAVNGFALGGGCELAMACDIRIASEKAKFAQPEVSLGIIPGFGGTQRLARLIGAGRAKELLFTGDVIDACEAYRIGLVNKVVAPNQVVNAALAMAARIVDQAPIAVQLCKAAVNAGLSSGILQGFDYEAKNFGLCFGTADQHERMAAFLNKRKPVFVGK